MGHLKHEKYKNKQIRNNILEPENNFKLINISISDKFEKKN